MSFFKRAVITALGGPLAGAAYSLMVSDDDGPSKAESVSDMQEEEHERVRALIEDGRRLGVQNGVVLFSDGPDLKSRQHAQKDEKQYSFLHPVRAPRNNISTFFEEIHIGLCHIRFVIFYRELF